jgi:hypothetical protein
VLVAALSRARKFSFTKEFRIEVAEFLLPVSGQTNSRWIVTVPAAQDIEDCSNTENKTFQDLS